MPPNENEMTDRKLVKDKLYSYELSNLTYKTIGEIISTLQKWQVEIMKNYKYSSVELHSYPNDDPYSRSDKEYFYFAGVRYENDKEYSERLKTEQKYKADQEAREKQQLEHLKKKYENTP